jgi:tetratricopeptide (TPR) repeat protein
MRLLFKLICIASVVMAFAPAGYSARKYYPPDSLPEETTLTDTKIKTSTVLPATPLNRLLPVKRANKKDAPFQVIENPVSQLIHQRQYYEALRLIDEKLKKQPKNIHLKLAQGLIYRKQENYEQSVAVFNSIISKLEKRPRLQASAFNGLGWTYYKSAASALRSGDTLTFQTDIQKAEENFRSSLRVYPKMSYSRVGLAEVALVNNEIEKANDYLAMAKKEMGHQTLPLQLLEAKLLLQANSVDSAQKILYGLRQSHDNEPEVLFLLAKSAQQKNNIDDAMIHLKQLLEMDPEQTEALKLLSQLYEAKLQPKSAKEALEKAVVLDPKDEASVQELLKNYDQQNQDSKSILLLKTVLNASPNNLNYNLALLRRFEKNELWDEILVHGEKLLASDDFQNKTNQLHPNRSVNWNDYNDIFAIVAFSVFKAEKRQLDVQQLLNQKGIAYAKWSLESQMALLQRINTPESNRQKHCIQLSLLLMDPLMNISKLPISYMPDTSADWSTLLQITLLQGDFIHHKKLLQLGTQHPEWISVVLPRLISIGDYSGAMVLMSPITPQNSMKQFGLSAEQLKAYSQQSSSANTVQQEQLVALKKLSRKASDVFFMQLATTALEYSTANAETHQVIAKSLKRRGRMDLASRQLKLAQQYTLPGEKKTPGKLLDLF